MFLRLILKLGHAAQFTKLGIAAQNPAQLRVLRHVALNKHDILFGVKTAGDILRQLLETAAAQVGRYLTDGDGVHIHDAVQALIFILQGHPVLNGAHIRAQGQFAAGFDTAENSLFAFHRIETSFSVKFQALNAEHTNSW